MKILLTADPILPVPPAGYGGIERIVDSLVGEYRKRGHTVALLAKAGSRCAADAVYAWPGNRIQSRIDTFRNARALARVVREFRPDRVHSFSRLIYLFGILPRNVPKIMSYQRHTGPRQIRIASRLAGRSLRFTGCSEFICNQGRPGGGAWSAIPNFVDLEKINFVPSVPDDAPLVFLSRVESIKGPDLAIEIARRAGRRLLIAGNRASEGPEARFFEEKVAPHLGENGIEWIGEVGDAEKNALLGRAAALLVPIQWEEPFGIVFAEALAAGTPVISCARGALPEIVAPDHTGFFIRDAADGVAAVARLSRLDRRACREVAEKKFSLGVCADHYLKLYLEFPGVSTTKPFKHFVRRGLHRVLRMLLRLRSTPLIVDKPAAVSLVIAPHPDDEAFGCGGLIATRRRQNLAVHVLYLTDGSASHHGHPTLTPWKVTSQRMLEARSAMSLLGVPDHCLHFLCAPDSQLPHLPAIVASSLVEDLSKIIAEVRPDDIFLPTRHDASTEHIAAHALVFRALDAGGHSYRIFEYPVWSWWNPRHLLRPAIESRKIYRVAPGPHTAAKAQALQVYRSQVEPTLPWTEPLLSPEFVHFFARGAEYFFEA